MASGFLVLPDGRCFARRWPVYDYALRAIMDALEADPAQRELRAWLGTFLPGPDDIDELGYGAWLRSADEENIERFLDMRQLAPPDQDAMCRAALAAAQLRAAAESKPAATGTTQESDGYVMELKDLAEMVAAYHRGEPPLSNSDWTSVVPPEDGPIGPGWQRKTE